MPNQHRYPNLNISGVSPELRQAVQSEAAARGESVSAVVRRALEEYVAEGFASSSLNTARPSSRGET